MNSVSMQEQLPEVWQWLQATVPRCLNCPDQGTPRLNMRPLLDKIYRVYRVVRRSSEASTTEEDGTGSRAHGAAVRLGE